MRHSIHRLVRGFSHSRRARHRPHSDLATPQNPATLPRHARIRIRSLRKLPRPRRHRARPAMGCMGADPPGALHHPARTRGPAQPLRRPRAGQNGARFPRQRPAPRPRRPRRTHPRRAGKIPRPHRPLHLQRRRQPVGRRRNPPFKKLGRADRIIAIVLRGEPHAPDPRNECYPPPLRHKLHPDGTVNPAEKNTPSTSTSARRSARPRPPAPKTTAPSSTPPTFIKTAPSMPPSPNTPASSKKPASSCSAESSASPPRAYPARPAAADRRGKETRRVGGRTKAHRRDRPCGSGASTPRRRAGADGSRASPATRRARARRSRCRACPGTEPAQACDHLQQRRSLRRHPRGAACHLLISPARARKPSAGKSHHRLRCCGRSGELYAV